MLFKSVNPFNLSTIKEYEGYSNQEVEKILLKAQATFLQWKKTSFPERQNLLESCSENLEKKKKEYATLITLEMGKPIKESIAEIEKCAAVCKYYAENGEKFLKIEEALVSNGKAYSVFQPLGGILAVMPWNFPFWQVFRFAIPTIFAGNVGILKHASNVSGCSLAIENIFLESGFPQGVFSSLLVNSSQVPVIIENSFIKAISLTGSEKAGSEVASIAGKNIKKSLLELGGSDPFIVLEDANIPEAAKHAVKTRMLNNGQSCISAKRFIIQENVYEAFKSAYIGELSLLKLGNPLTETTDVGPMARIDLRNELINKINESIEEGATLTIGGKIRVEPGAFIEPTILENVKFGMVAYEEELFGPVAAFIKVKNSEEAIRIANDSKFGLGASLWTANYEEAEKLALDIEAGNVFINAIVASNPQLPFGGIKLSGFGRELGLYGIKEFVNIKTIFHA